MHSSFTTYLPVHRTSISGLSFDPIVFKYSDLLIVGNALILQYSEKKNNFDNTKITINLKFSQILPIHTLITQLPVFLVSETSFPYWPTAHAQGVSLEARVSVQSSDLPSMKSNRCLFPKQKNMFTLLIISL